MNAPTPTRLCQPFAAAGGKIQAAVLLVLLVLSGCATYSDSFSAIERDLATQQFDAALQRIEAQAGQKNQRVLYLLNKGMVLRMQRDFAGSNLALEAAKQEIEQLYASSVSENALSFIVNDATTRYAGDDYEQVLLHLYMALNFLELGQRDAARVEALQIDLKLRELGEKSELTRLSEHAFSRYLTALIYEDGGEWSDAMIAYRKAYEEYKKASSNKGGRTEAMVAAPDMIPDLLKSDLLRTSHRLGLRDEEAKYKKEFGIAASKNFTPENKPMPANKLNSEKNASVEKKYASEKDATAEQGELIFILHNGLAPIKREQAATLFDPISGHIVRIALPYYESRLNDVVAARISVMPQQLVPNAASDHVLNEQSNATLAAAQTELMENVDAVAKQTLAGRMAAITARSLARAVAKVKMQQAVTKSGERGSGNEALPNLLGGFAMQIAAIATERADTRSWLTLPANIQLARLPLPAGKYRVKVEFLAAGERVLDAKIYPEMMIHPTRKTYLTEHWVSVQSLTRSSSQTLTPGHLTIEQSLIIRR